MRFEQSSPGIGAHHHGVLAGYVVAGPQPVQRKAVAGRLAKQDREIRTTGEHRVGDLRVLGHVRERLFHAAQPPVHLEDARRNVAAEKGTIRARRLDDRVHPGEQVLGVLDGETIGEHLAAGSAGQRPVRDLIETVVHLPPDAPIVGMSLAGGFVDDALHGVVVVDPGLADVVAHGLADVGGRDFQQFAQMFGRAGVKPHEDRDAIDGLSTKGGVNALLAGHTEVPCRHRPHYRLMRRRRAATVHRITKPVGFREAQGESCFAACAGFGMRAGSRAVFLPRRAHVSDGGEAVLRRQRP